MCVCKEEKEEEVEGFGWTEGGEGGGGVGGGTPLSP